VVTLRRSPRLPNFDYRGFSAYFVTSVTRERRPYFAQSTVLQLAEGCLNEVAAGHAFSLLAYCFMPDHLHVLALAECGESDLKEFVRQFKQRSGFHAKKLLGSELWQISYHDHVLRNEESLVDVARYIWANPMRAGLVDDFRQYRGSGPHPLPDWV
jgi:putative transposase